MTEIKNVILIGAGGNLGPSVLKEFLSSPFNVSVLSRAESSSKFPEGVKVIKTPYDPESLKKAFTGQDAVVAIVGGTGFPEQVKIIDAAIAAGVKRFIPSEFGSDTATPRLREIVPVFNGKRQIVEYLQTKESQISWTGLITGPFADWGIKIGFFGFGLNDKTAKIFDGGNHPFQSSNLSFIGKALVSVLQHPTETANKYVYVASHTATQNEILAELEKQTGAKFSITNVSTKELLADATAKFQAGDFGSIVALIQGANLSDEELGDFVRTLNRPLSNDVLGLPKENLAETVRAVLAGEKP